VGSNSLEFGPWVFEEVDFMARPRSRHPTDAELEILSVLWDTGPAELGRITEVLAEARGRAVPSTTTATMLDVMRKKGLVGRRKGPRGFRWSAKVSREAAARSLFGRIVDSVFEGSTKRLVMQLVSEGRLSASEREEIRRLLDETKGRRGKGGGR
jgi:predicted transcriptional regulator